MNKRIQRLLPVVDMAQTAEREATAKLNQYQNALQKAQQQLQNLQQYRDDYQQQWIDKGQSGVSGQWLMNYQRFLSQLETAVSQQEKSVLWHEQNVSLSQATWQQAYARLEGLRKLVQRYREEVRKSADKQEQKLLDEMAQRLMAQHAKQD
ncbi:flagella biosynthesis chaperone FliJ [Pseudomonas sp. C27(2019)]|uniref:flagellar export protein FliJ n=1 Tax=Pseudomonas sp. C27(2019) TaxID=2604941 RepID=UPI0012474122|nr:flagellar export protein FliJ [Pseudomonas sp. C27(2019)]QEY58566.1 flagella biosynthesis chaperone FliJ [Pseudomonas sp. C27(2019)]